jgi:hypothetical protein
MDFEIAKISDNPTIEEIESEINRLKFLKTDYHNKDQGLKVLINSVYGVLGYIKFICYDKDVAESITKQSQDVIKYTIKIFDEFFYKHWNDNTELHQKLGITKPYQVDKSDRIVNYADTDSIFVCLGKIYDGSDYDGSKTDFIFDLHKYALDEYSKNKFEDYISKYNGFKTRTYGVDIFKLELEEIDDNTLFVAKKKYIKNPIYADGEFFDSLSKLKVKGLESNTSAIPKWVRNKLNIIEHEVMKSGGNLDTSKMIKLLKSIKSEFQTANIEDISVIQRANKYNENILNDTTALEFVSGLKPHIKGAGHHNFLLRNSKYGNKYGLIPSGSKVHWYYCKNGVIESFAFLTGKYPIEFAPDIDMDAQFTSVFLQGVNNILKVLGVPKLNHKLILKASFDL